MPMIEIGRYIDDGGEIREVKRKPRRLREECRHVWRKRPRSDVQFKYTHACIHCGAYSKQRVGGIYP